MRVIIVADFADMSGGAPRVAVLSARGLAEAGCQVTFIHAISGADGLLAHPNIETVCCDLPDIWSRPTVSAALNGVWSREAGARLAAALAPFVGLRNTVVHLHQWTRSFSPAAFAALRASGLPLVITAHDYFLACPNGVFFRFNRMEPCELTPLGVACVAANCDTRSYPHKLVRAARQIATNLEVHGSIIDVVHIADSAKMRLQPFLPKSWRHHRIDNPICVDKGAPAQIGDASVYAYVGRLTADKGTIVAARAAAQVGARILFIGDGPARDEIRSILPDAEITGWMKPDDVQSLLRARARALLAPSLWPETGPMTPLEAAALGVPAIVSRRCGASQTIAPHAGIVAEPDVNSFARAMRDLGATHVAQSMGAAAYEGFWSAPPSPAVHAEELAVLYDGLLARHRDAAPDQLS